MSLAVIIFVRRLGLKRRDSKGRTNEEGRGRGGRWRVGKASGGGRDLLRAYERRSWATRRGHTTGKDFMHTAPFGCTAHLACSKVHMARVCSCRSSRI
jgi:hypothetical protein